jgi:NADH-quinone oxidoreductase E subunit
MSAPTAGAVKQPESFAFTPENLATAKSIMAKYPEDRQGSAVMPLLHLAQRQNANWLPRVAIDYVADMVGMARIRAYEVATFYTMYNLAPVGKHMIEVCTTTPCWLRGSDAIVHACEKRLGIQVGETTADGMFTLREAECLAACVNAPMIQIADEYYEDLTPESMVALIDTLAKGGTPKPGPQNSRKTSEPEGGPTTLIESAKRAGVQPAKQG